MTDQDPKVLPTFELLDAAHLFSDDDLLQLEREREEALVKKAQERAALGLSQLDWYGHLDDSELRLLRYARRFAAEPFEKDDAGKLILIAKLARILDSVEVYVDESETDA